jgi:polar amino acid transport system substrate-binding protein
MPSNRGELAPEGVLRVGVVYAPTMSTFFVEKDAQGIPCGPTVELGTALASSIGCDVNFLLVPNSGELVDAVESRLIDIAFMPMDDERRSRVAFGASYFIIESTALVSADSPFETASDLNRSGVRIAGIANTTTIRNAARVLEAADVVSVTSVEEAMLVLRNKHVDAVVLSRDVLAVYQTRMQNTRVLDGTLHSTGIAISVAKDQPVSLTVASNFIEAAKTSGLLRKIFDDFGFAADSVAPLGQ